MPGAYCSLSGKTDRRGATQIIGRKESGEDNTLQDKILLYLQRTMVDDQKFTIRRRAGRLGMQTDGAIDIFAVEAEIVLVGK